MRRLVLLLALLVLAGCGFTDGSWKYDKTEPVGVMAGNGMPTDYGPYGNLAKKEPCDLLTEDEATAILGGPVTRRTDKEYELRHSDMLRLDCAYTADSGQVTLGVLTPGSRNAATAIGNQYASLRDVTVVPGYGRFAYWSDGGALHIWHEGRSLTVTAADLATAKKVADVVLRDL